ncbi:MAG: VanW family protein, partial [Oscillospiraceae bacterium]|nr:VanW family protein [Oscillospiraceae bacterium]
MAILYGNSKNSKHTLSKKNKKAGSAGGSHLNVNIPVEDIPAEAVTQEIPAAEPVIQEAPAAVPVSVQEPAPVKEPKAKKIKEPKPAKEPKAAKVKEPKPAKEPKAAKVKEPKPAKEPKAAKVKEPKPAKEPKVKKEGGSKKGKIIGITAGAVAALLVAGTMAFGSHVASTDTAYPNVTINGIDVGGMDYDKAYDTLKENGYNSKANTAVINVKAGGRAIDEVRVSSEDAKLTMSLDRAATTAVEYGHGNVFDSAFKYLKCMSGKTELLEGKTAFDEESVRAIIAKTAERVDSEYLDNSYTVGEEAVQVTKGAGERHVDQDEVYEMIRNAFETGNFSIMEYESSVKEPEALDFNAIGEEVFVEPQNAKYDTKTQGVVKGVPGKTLDVIELKKQYLKAAPGETFEVPITLVAPEIDGSNMEDLLFRDTLASKSTNLTSDSNRNNNITLAAKAINGTVLNPGDVFSFNGIVGQRTTAKGYKTAHAYANGDIVDTVGGGIC